MTISLEQAQRELAHLLESLPAGEEVVITRNGHVVGKLIAIGTANGDVTPATMPEAGSTSDLPPRRLGWAKDIIVSISPDFDEPLEDFREYME
jgi:antitoxin (DNA-binding transcriptional repressor) of toxin-antitoxin stability system